MTFLQSLIDGIGLGSIYAVVAVGIGLVFGVMRLVNFAYGELITAGGYTLALLSNAPAVVAIIACFAVVVTLALIQERIAFRPLRGASPATMLIATFAVSFLLQNVYLLAFGSRGSTVGTLGGLNTAIAVGSLRIRWITIVAAVAGGVLLAALTTMLNRTMLGLQLRAAAADLRTARTLGVRANRVMAAAFAISGLLAAAVAVLLTVQSPLVTPDFGVQITIFGLVGVVVGGLDRLVAASLGGFAIGFANAFVGDLLPSASSVYLPSVVYGLVIVVLLLRPNGLLAGRRATAAERVWRRALDSLVALAAPLVLVVVVAAVGSQLDPVRQLEFGEALANVAIVVALYVFVGNSGVLSFGHISFVAVGAYLSGELTLDVQQKQDILPQLFGVLRNTHTSTSLSLLLAAAAGALFALVAGIPLMRLSGLPAGIATFAVLGITTNIISYWDKIGPGVTALALVPQNGVWTLMVGALIAIVVAFGYQRSPPGRRLRATEDPLAAQASGIHVHRERLYAFVISGALAGFAGGLLVHELRSITTAQVGVELTFTTLAMLVVGGVGSLFGAVLGALLISGLNSFLADAEQGVNIGFQLTLPTGTRLVTIGAVMALVLILRPSGIVAGREVRLPRRRRRAAGSGATTGT